MSYAENFPGFRVERRAGGKVTGIVHGCTILTRSGFSMTASSRSLNQTSRDTQRQSEKNQFFLWEVRQTASPGLALVYIVDRAV